MLLVSLVWVDILPAYMKLVQTSKSSRNSWMLNSLNTLAVAPKTGILVKEGEVINAFLNETGQLVHHFLEERANAVWRT